MGIKMKLRGLFASALLALSVAVPTQGFAITNVLYLTMDASGSISNTNWDLQVNGYISALNAVVGGGGFYGNTAIGVSVFGAGVAEVSSLSTINNIGDLNALTAAIADTITGGSNQRGGVSTIQTHIADAIDHAAAAIGTFGLGTNNVIDVSTDGGQNGGTNTNPVSAANNALAGGITTNCLGVGGGANCNFETGFEILVADFAGFGAAMTNKLEQELNVPEPGILALLSTGLIAIGFVRRKGSI